VPQYSTCLGIYRYYFCFAIKNERSEENRLLNHPEPTPLNFFIKFKFRSKKSANQDYEKRLKQAIQHDPSSKKLLDLKRRLDMGGYKNDWTHYEDRKDNRKANVFIVFYYKGRLDFSDPDYMYILTKIEILEQGKEKEASSPY
jgi:hypothetical protein